MLCSYGFILQLRRSPTPCCAGNGTLVTRVHRVQLACERQAAQSWRIRASSLPLDFWCKLGLFDLCCLEKQSAALRAAGSLFIRKGRTPDGPQQTGGFHGGRTSRRPKSPGPGVPISPPCSALLCREGSNDFGGSWITPNCLGLVGFLVGAHHPWSQLGPSLLWNYVWTAGTERGLVPWFSTPSGFHWAMDLLSLAPDDRADTPVRK